MALLSTFGGAERVQPHPQALATTVLPTDVPCGPIATDPGDPHTATWTATSSPYGTGGPYNLPVSATNNPDPTIPSCDAIVVPPDVTLRIDPSQGMVKIYSHGAAIKVDGGHLVVSGTSDVNSALFDAEPDVASWDGIVVDANSGHLGNASLAFASVQHALNSITITSGATSTPDPTDLTAPPLPFGLALINSGIGPSYFDGIDATNTPVLIKGRADPATSRADGKFGTVNNIGSQGINVSFDADGPAVTTALDVESVTFGSSVPFAESPCLPLQLPCSAGSIGNDAILARFTAPNPPPVVINQSRFYRAGEFGVELSGPNRPLITNNNFDCNGTGSANPRESCVGTKLKYSAIYLNNATADLENSITNNVGHEDGLDAIVLNGSIVYAAGVSPQILTWKNATNDATSDHLLGYLLDGDLNLAGGTLVVPDGSVVKSRGTINLTRAALDAHGSGLKVFTSLRDNVNIASCPSVFVQSCPSPLAAGEWGGIDLVGSGTDARIRNATWATINNASILYATTGINILNGASLAVGGGSVIGPTFADGVLAEGTPIAVTGTTFGCPPGVCSGPSSGNHGILADFTGTAPLPGGLKIGGPSAAERNTFQGSVNEAIRGVGLTGQTVDVENNAIQNAGASGSAGSAGIYLQGADNPILRGNDVVGSGTGTAHNAAIWLDGVSHADFNGPISNNTGSGNGLNAIAFHGDTRSLAWQTVQASGRLGFIVDGSLLVAGDLMLVSGDYAAVQAGTITVQGGTLTSTGAVLTSLKEQTALLASCGSVFVPKVSGVCAPPSAGDWGGLVLDPGKANQLTDSEVRDAITGISVGVPGGSLAQNLTLTRTNVRNTSADGLSTRSPVSIVGGAFTNNGGRGIRIDLTGLAPSLLPVTITGHTTVTGSGQDGILAVGLAGQTVRLQDASVDHAGAFGINLKDADHLTLSNNTVTNSAATFPAIYLNGFSGLFANIHGNRGAANGVDAIAFHGTVTDDLSWQTARQTGDPTRLLGYVLDGTLNMQSPNTLTVNAGDIVKIGNRGVLNLQGVTLRADDTGNSSQKVFTSLTDDSIGVSACHSAVVIGCTGTPNTGDWGGINLSGGGANGVLVNAAVRYASTGILITSQASSTAGSSVYGLVVSRSAIGPTSGDGINAVKTPISVTDSTVRGGTHGITVDLGGSLSTATLRLSGNRFMSTGAEAILGQALSGRPVWITDNAIQGAGAFGIRLLNADALVLRNNNIAGSGGGPGAGAGRYPAIYLSSVSADFTRNIRGNVGSGNALDVIAFHGTANGDLSWRTPTVNASTAALGYVLDGSLTVNDGTLTVHPGDVVKSLGGPITVSGGTLDASNNTDPRTKVFTSLKDQSAYPQTCPSILTGLCASGPEQGDWGGIVITNDTSGRPGSASIANGQLSFAATALSIDSGPTASFGTSNLGLIVVGTTISDATGDGINAQDTPISVTTTTIQRVAVHGVVATFFGGTPCVSACGTSLDLEHVSVTSTSKDGIVASGLGGRPSIVSDNVISGAGTYGIRLAGADRLTLNNNTVSNSGGPATTFRYPAIYLSSVKADFELRPGTSTVAGNHGSGNGIDTIVIHGEASRPLTWLTTGVAAPVVVPPVAADHFGYMLDGGLTVDGMLTTNLGDIVKVLGGAIQINGGLVSTGTAFTSLKDGGVPIKLCDSGYDSVFIHKVSGSCPAPASGDWAGITTSAASTLTSTTIGFDDGLTVTGGALQFAGGAMHDIARNAIVVSGSPLSVTNVVFSRVGNDAIDGTNSGSTDTITDDRFDHVGGVAINLKNAPADLERNVFTSDASPTVQTSGAPVSLQCSSIQSGGVTGDAGLIVKESDFAPGVGMTAPAGASAENNWWGQATGPSGQLFGGVTVSTYFTTQNPTATIAITGKPSATQPLDPVKSDGSLGTGLVQATLTFSRNMNPEATLPSVSYASSPVSFIGAWKLNDPRTWMGTAAIDSSLASNTTHTVSAVGAHDCVPDLLHNLMTPASNTFVADTTTLPNVSVSAPADLVGAGSARLHGHIDPKGWATPAAHSGQFVLTNIANPSDQHTYSTPPLTDKTTPLDFTLVATGLNKSTTYTYRLLVPSVNGTATQPTTDALTTTAPSKLVFTSSPPTPIAAGSPFSVTIQVRDQSGNLVIDDTSNVTLAIGTNPSSGTLGGTATVAAVGGVASFSALSIDKAGNGYTLTASDGSLTGASSGAFDVTAPTATALSSGPTTPYPATPTVTITATITASGAPNPGVGSVAFKAAGASISAACDSASVTAGQATCVADYADVNGKALTAQYSGGTGGSVAYTGSSGATLTATTITVSHTGSPEVFTATVHGGPSGNGDGRVTFLANGAVLCSVPLSSGAASCTPSPALTAGTVVTGIYVPPSGSSFASSDNADTA